MQVTLTPYGTRYLEEMIEFEGFETPEEALRHVLRTYQKQAFVRDLREEAKRTEDPAYVASLPEWTDRSMDEMVGKVLSCDRHATRQPTPWHLFAPESLDFETPSLEEQDHLIAEEVGTYWTDDSQHG